MPVPDAVYSRLLALVDDSPLGRATVEQAVRLALKLLRRRAEDADERDVMRKAVQAMQRRGFGYDEAKNALQTALKQLENEED